MKILKIYGFIIGIIALLNMGFYLKNNGIIHIGLKIASKEKWQEILIGRWKLEIIEEPPLEMIFYIGEIEFFADSTFIKEVTYESFDREFPNEEFNFEQKGKYNFSSADILANGPVRGKWQIGDGLFWSETTSTCGIALNDFSSTRIVENDLHYYDDEWNDIPIWCERFEPGITFNYGEFNDDTFRSKLKKFTKNEILIERTYFKDNSKATISFKRLKS